MLVWDPPQGEAPGLGWVLCFVARLQQVPETHKGDSSESSHCAGGKTVPDYAVLSNRASLTLKGDQKREWKL